MGIGTQHMEMTKRQLEILQHALGVDQYGRGQQYRNFFCAGEEDEPTCRELVAMGYMAEHKRTELYPYFNCSVTNEGRNAMLRESPHPPKLSRAKKRYLRWLENRDAISMTFGEYLKSDLVRQ